MSFGVFDERQAGNWTLQFDDTTYPTPGALTLQDVRAIRLDTIIGTNNDTVDHAVGVYLDLGTGPEHFGAFTLPANSGEPTFAAVDVLDAIIPSTSPGLVLQPGTVIGFAQYDALASGKLIRLVAFGGYI